MALAIEDYGLIGDMRGSGLVGRNGSIDWLCWPRFDADACLAALLGNEEHGHWLIAPECVVSADRRYRRESLVLETDFETATGAVRVIDFMPPHASPPQVVRVVQCLRGRAERYDPQAGRLLGDFPQAYRWVHAPIAALSLWLITSPFTLGYSSDALVWSDVLSGCIALVMSLAALGSRRGLVSWLIAIVGLWLLFAPLLFWAPEAAARNTRRPWGLGSHGATH